MTYYIGFGKDCYVADFMENSGMRSFSFPFDWIFAFPCTIKESLDKNFEDWLDPKYLTNVYNPNRNPEWDRLVSTSHCLYNAHMEELDMLYSDDRHAFFNHHDVLSEEGRALFERRIQRYKNVIASSEDIVFITNSSVNSFIEVGLLDYYKDRNAKTTVIFLNPVYSKETGIKYKNYDSHHVVTYSTKHNTKEIAKQICQKLEKHFGKANLKDPIGLKISGEYEVSS
jgi:hypothetical protein